MFEQLKLRRSIKKLELEYEKAALEKAVEIVQEAADNLVKDEDTSNWLLLGQSGEGRLSETGHQEMVKQAFKLWDKNLHARAIIRTMVKFVIGRGAKIIPKSKAAEKYWDNFKVESYDSNDNNVRRHKWNHKEKEIFNRLFRDGETIMRFFKGGMDDKGLVTMRFIRPGRIQNPKDKDYSNVKGEIVTYGIGHDPEDVEKYINYYLVDDEGKFKAKIPANEILHYKIFADTDMKRGVSLLKVVAPMLAKYEGWLEDRITLNKIRTAVALIRKVDAPAGQIQQVRDSLQSEMKDSDRKKMKMFERGTILTSSKNVEYDMVSPNIHAQDVAQDGRSMLLSIAAAVGFPEMILTADYSNANYSSTLIAQNPFVREIEDWQDYAMSIYKDIFALVIGNAIEVTALPEGTSTDCEVQFPPMIYADHKSEAEAFQIEHMNRVRSRKSWQLELGLDPEKEKANFDDEDSEGPYPEAPAGGFGAPGGGAGGATGEEDEEEYYYEE
jgi:capsid protein